MPAPGRKQGWETKNKNLKPRKEAESMTDVQNTGVQICNHGLKQVSPSCLLGRLHGKGES